MACIEKRTSKSGPVSFRVKIGIQGYPPQTATFARLTDARRWAAETEAAIRNGRHFSTGSTARHTLGDLVDLLREMVRRVDNPYLFPAPAGRGKIGLRTAWEVAVRRAGGTTESRPPWTEMAAYPHVQPSGGPGRHVTSPTLCGHTPRYCRKQDGCRPLPPLHGRTGELM